MQHPSVSDGHDGGPHSGVSKMGTGPGAAKGPMIIITEAEKKKRVVNTMLGLGFVPDSDQWEEQGWIRFKHPINEGIDFQINWYRSMYDLDNLSKVSDMLRKLGQYQKIQQLNSYI